MLNILNNTETKQNNELEKNNLKISDIEKYYLGSKNKKMCYGLEYERLSLDKKTYKNVSYDVMEKILRHFASIQSWDLIYDGDLLVGVEDNKGTSISLEPGCQIELSLAPMSDILSISVSAFRICQLLDKIADVYGVTFLSYGISPVSSQDEITQLKRKRYDIMSRFLPSRSYGELSLKMMKSTAGFQINIDYKDKIDAFYKLKFFNLISPFLSALSSNSPIESNRLFNKNSQRMNVWRYTGRERCNLFYGEIFNNAFGKYNVIKNYIDSILDVPMMFIQRGNEFIEIMGKITFREYMKNGYLSYYPIIEDYILHQSLCFPDVRLRKYIEIRNHDSNDLKTILGFIALYKGLCQNNIKDNLDHFKYLKINKIDEYYNSVVRHGLDYNFEKNINGWHIVKTLFEIARRNLTSQERMYLEPILNMIKLRKTNADWILDYQLNNVYDLVQFLN